LRSLHRLHAETFLNADDAAEEEEDVRGGEGAAGWGWKDWTGELLDVDAWSSLEEVW
jgi:hypothetical protein